jgi:hypothetical protein
MRRRACWGIIGKRRFGCLEPRLGQARKAARASEGGRGNIFESELLEPLKKIRLAPLQSCGRRVDAALADCRTCVQFFCSTCALSFFRYGRLRVS